MPPQFSLRDAFSGPHAKTARRLVGLDVLRAIAVFLTFWAHIPPRYLSDLGLWTVLYLGGPAGVDLFFVLSGFLVGGLLFRDYPTVYLRRFLLRRALKIYPAFWVMLAVTVVLGWTLRPVSVSALVAEVLFIQNYVPGVFDHTWSLAVEEHFYLLAAVGVACAGFARWPLWIAPIVSGLLLIVCGFARSLTVHQPAPYLPWATHLRLDQLSIGVAMAAMARAGHLNRFRQLCGAPVLLVVAVGCAVPRFLGSVYIDPWQFVYGVPLVGLSAAAWLLLAVDWRGPRWIARIGRDSYSIYLWHIPVFLQLQRWQPESWIMWFAVASAVSVGVGIVMSALIEWPILRWRDRHVPDARRVANTRHAAQNFPGRYALTADLSQQ